MVSARLSHDRSLARPDAPAAPKRPVEAASRWLSVALAGLALATAAHAQLLVNSTQSLDPPVPPDSAGIFFGDAMTWADVDGDGRDELLVSYEVPGSSEFQITLWWSTPGGLVMDSNQILAPSDVSLAACDFDPLNPGEEVLVGIPESDVQVGMTLHSNVGAVAVYDWTAASVTLLDLYSQDDVGDSPLEGGDEFGFSLATGDYDGDGQCDVAVGAPGEDIDAFTNLGVVQIRWGPRIGGAWTEEIEARDLRGATPVASQDRFGEVLATAQFTFQQPLSPHPQELVVGAPQNADHGNDAGIVWVLQYDEPAPQPFDGDRFYASDAGLTSQAFNGFGAALAVGDLTGDLVDDLAIGARDFRVGPGNVSSGIVVVLPGTGDDTVSAAGAQVRDIRDAGGTLDSDDGFGEAVAIGRVFGGTTNDLLVSAPGSPSEGLVAIFRGDQQLGWAQNLEQDDLPNEDADNDQFGSSLLFGDTQADGTPELAIAVRRENREQTRGFGDGDSMGRVHVLPVVERLRAVEVLVSDNELFHGELITQLPYPPRHNPTGEASLVVGNDVMNHLAITTTQIIDESSALHRYVGLDAAGNTAWIDQVDQELAVSSRGVVYSDGDPAPVDGVLDFHADDDAWLRDQERLFFLTQTTAPLRRVLFQRDFPSTDASLLLASGQTVGVPPSEHTVADIFRMQASPNGDHWIAHVDLGGGDGLVLDGELVLDTTLSPRGDPPEIVDLAAGNDGVGAFTVSLGPTFGVVGTTDQAVALGSDGDVDGIPLSGLLAGNTAISAWGEVISTWRVPTGNAEVISLLCRDQNTSPLPAGMSASDSRRDVLDLSRGSLGGSGTRVLVVGDPLDTNDDGEADATLIALDPDAGGAPEISREGHAVVRAGIAYHDDPGVFRTVLMRFASPTCPMFSDGFESGTLDGWQ